MSASPTGSPGHSIPPDLLPSAADPDNDGFGTLEEVAAGTNPSDWDTDRGGEPDGSEATAGRNPRDPADDQPDPGCLPEGAEQFEDGADEEPPRDPELEAMIPTEVAGHTLHVTSMAGLPRRYGFFNYFWDGLLHCVDAVPADLAHAFGGVVLASSDEGFGSSEIYAVFAIRIGGATGADVARTLVDELVRQGRGEVIAASRSAGGRDYTLLSSGGAVYSAGDVSFWMVEMTVLDSGIYPRHDFVDLELVEATVVQLPPP